MTSKTRVLVPLIVVLVALFCLLTFLPLDPILYAARFAAFGSVVLLMWQYHRLADWSVVEIGRSTMAIKGAILILAAAANLHSIDVFTDASFDTAFDVAARQGWVHAVSEVAIVLGWICMAAALIHRDRLVVKLQGEAHALPSPPPPNRMPSEDRKE